MQEIHYRNEQDRYDIACALMNVKRYDELFAEYTLLHDYFGRGGNDVMRRLRRIAEQ